MQGQQRRRLRRYWHFGDIARVPNSVTIGGKRKSDSRVSKTAFDPSRRSLRLAIVRRHNFTVCRTITAGSAPICWALATPAQPPDPGKAALTRAGFCGFRLTNPVERPWISLDCLGCVAYNHTFWYVTRYGGIRDIAFFAIEIRPIRQRAKTLHGPCRRVFQRRSAEFRSNLVPLR